MNQRREVPDHRHRINSDRKSRITGTDKFPGHLEERKIISPGSFTITADLGTG